MTGLPSRTMLLCLCAALEEDDDGDDALTLNAQCQSPAATLALEPRM